MDLEFLSNISYIHIAVIIFVMIFLYFLKHHHHKRKNRKRTPSSSKSLFIPKPSFVQKMQAVFESPSLNEDKISELEEILLTADTGVVATEKLIQKVFAEKKSTSPEQIFADLKKEIEIILTPKSDFKIQTQNKPFVIYLVGVNGVGKTTTIGKLAHQFKVEGHQVMLVAADTFRAAAVNQLRIWAERNDVFFVGGKENADPSSVIVDGLQSAQSKNVDVVIIDTAGRLHTKSNLMQELQKMTRMSEKVLQKKPDEIFLVIDAITGQNGFNQAKVFIEAISVSGIVLTKYDATAKGGIIISIVEETGIPVRYVGLGEGLEDLKKFDAKEFVEKIFG